MGNTLVQRHRRVGVPVCDDTPNNTLLRPRQQRAPHMREVPDRFINLLGGEQVLSADQRDWLSRADEAFMVA